MARRKSRAEEQPRELTRKETRLHAQQRERNRKIMLGTGIALALALVLVIAGLVSEFLIRPNSAVATVGETQLVTRDFWKRTFLEQNRLQNQLIRMSQLEQQFGGQGFFASQINQIQATLSSPFTLGVQVLDQMIQEEVIKQQAAARGITVTDAEIDEALREEVAAQQSAVTVPQATETAEAQVGATATAESWTPTPTATVDASGSITATATPFPTPVPPTPLPVLTDEQYTTGLAELEANLREIADMTLVEYRQIVAARLLNEKLLEIIGEEQVEPTSEQVHARHILIEVSEPITPTTAITPTTEITGSAEITSTELAAPEETDVSTDTSSIDTSEEITATNDVTATEDSTAENAEMNAEEVSATEETTATEEVENTEEVAESEEVTATAELAESEAVTGTETMTGTETLSDTATLSDTVAPETTPEPLGEAEALALALELRQRLLDGEDFATLAAEYSSDTTSAVNGGDLDWIGRGETVAPFEEAAFNLEPGQISDPVRSDFGYHIIEVLEKDAERPKEEATLTQERATAYQTWLDEQVAATPVERPSDLVSKLPRGLEPFVPQALPAPVATTAAPVTQ